MRVGSFDEVMTVSLDKIPWGMVRALNGWLLHWHPDYWLSTVSLGHSLTRENLFILTTNLYTLSTDDHGI